MSGVLGEAGGRGDTQQRWKQSSPVLAADHGGACFPGLQGEMVLEPRLRYKFPHSRAFWHSPSTAHLPPRVPTGREGPWGDDSCPPNEILVKHDQRPLIINLGQRDCPRQPGTRGHPHWCHVCTALFRKFRKCPLSAQGMGDRLMIQRRWSRGSVTPGAVAPGKQCTPRGLRFLVCQTRSDNNLHLSRFL